MKLLNKLNEFQGAPALRPVKGRRPLILRVPELLLHDLSHCRIQRFSRWFWTLLTLFCAAATARPAPRAAQVMARPGWAGSGVSPEVWWRNAVFYRVDPARFQDGSVTGKGDLPGLGLRMLYLHALGVDGIILEGSFDSDALSDLLRTATQNQLRVLMEVTPEMQAGDRSPMLAQVHGWLGMGAAGLYVPPPAYQGIQAGAAASGYRALLLALEGMVHSLPGDRVLLAGDDVSSGPGTGVGRDRRGTGLFHSQDGLLVTRAYLPSGQGRDAAALRESLSALASNAASAGAADAAVIQFARNPATGSPDAIALATALLTSRGDVLFDFGDEIGLDTASAVSGSAGHAVLPVMQWTPSNVQRAVAPTERAEGTPGVTSFGPYRPYVRPPPAALTGAAPGLPGASIDATLPAELPAPDTLPGFTAGHLPNPPIDGARINVATEERDPHSVLNAYRQLIALRHGHAALLSGVQVVLNRDRQGADVWVRRAPASQRAGDVLVAVNLSDQAVTLTLDEDLERLGIRTGSLRPLFTASPTPLTAEETGALMLPPHAVFVGEVRRR